MPRINIRAIQPLAPDPAEAELIAEARRHWVQVLFSAPARKRGQPYITLIANRTTEPLGVFRRCSAALAWLDKTYGVHRAT